jgi:recombinational DNA repair protein (RecF pathway)
MAPRRISQITNCMECRVELNERTFWLDDGGALCRECAVRRRSDRMRRNCAVPARFGSICPKGSS